MASEPGLKKKEERHFVRMKQHITGRKVEKEKDEDEKIARVNVGIFCEKHGALKIVQFIVILSACFATVTGNWLVTYNHLIIYHYVFSVIIMCAVWVFVLAMTTLFNVCRFFKDPHTYYKVEYHCYVIMIVLLLPPTVLTFSAIGEYPIIISAVLQVVSILLFLVSVNDLYRKWFENLQPKYEEPDGESEPAGESSRTKLDRQYNEQLRIRNKLQELTSITQQLQQGIQTSSQWTTSVTGSPHHNNGSVQNRDARNYPSETESNSTQRLIQSKYELSRKKSQLTDDTFHDYQLNQIVYRINEEAKTPLTPVHNPSLVEINAHESGMFTFEDTLARENENAMTQKEYLQNLYKTSAVNSNEFEDLVHKMNHILEENNVSKKSSKSVKNVYEVDSDAFTFPPPFHASSISSLPIVDRKQKYNKDYTGV